MVCAVRCDSPAKVIIYILSATQEVNVASNIEPSAYPTRVLVFGHRSDRNKTALIRSIVETLKDSGIYIQHVIFTTFEERRDGTTSIGKFITIFTTSTDTIRFLQYESGNFVNG